MQSESIYRMADGLYRLHEDLFHVEHSIAEATWLHLRSERLKTNTTMGALVGSVLLIVPILVSVSGIAWSSAPAWAFYVIAMGLSALWMYQVREQRGLYEKLDSLEKDRVPTPLERRHDFLLESIALYGQRIRLLDTVIQDLEGAVREDEPAGGRNTTSFRLQRFQEIRDQCRDMIETRVATADELGRKGVFSDEQLRQIQDWAAPFQEAGGSA